MEGNNSDNDNDNDNVNDNDDNNSDNDNDNDENDDDNDNSIHSTHDILPIGSSHSVSDWNGTKKHVAIDHEISMRFASRLGKRLDDTSTCCSTTCMEESSSTFLEGSMSSLKYIHKPVEVDEECKDRFLATTPMAVRQGNYSATNNDFNSTNFTTISLHGAIRTVARKSRAKIRVARNAIQPLSMGVKCLPRELEMKKVEEENVDNTNREGSLG